MVQAWRFILESWRFILEAPHLISQHFLEFWIFSWRRANVSNCAKLRFFPRHIFAIDFLNSSHQASYWPSITNYSILHVVSPRGEIKLLLPLSMIPEEYQSKIFGIASCISAQDGISKHAPEWKSVVQKCNICCS